MRLLERGDALDQAAEALARARAGRGSVLLLSGEAGLGKSSLIAELLRTLQGSRLRVLQGGCEDLHAPRPLGPVHEIARGGLAGVQALLGRHQPAAEVAAALLAALDVPHQPTLLVVEDLHWADDATLDLLKHLGRRIARLPVLLLLSYRDDELGPEHPLNRLLGDLPAEACVRLALAPLSAQAVAQLCAQAGRPAAGLHEATGGNPFFVTEVLASGVDGAHTGVPTTVREAVHTRVQRLAAGPREVLQALCVVPGSVSLALAHALLPGRAEALDACLSSGLLLAREGALAFRHELARRAVQDLLAPMQRRARHAAVLAALRAGGPASPARLAHHAAEAGDIAQVLAFAPLAARQAAATGAHRQAALQLAAALAVADQAPAELQAQLQESWSYEAALALRIDAAVIAARHRAIALWRGLGRVEKVGLNLRWLSRLHWYQGEAELAERYAAEAVELLQAHAPGPELAWAYATRAQLHMLQDRLEPALLWGERAIALATRLGEREVLCHVLNTVGTAELFAGRAQGEARLERSLELARQCGFHEQAARVYSNRAEHAVVFKDFAQAERWLSEGIAFDRRFDLDAWTPYLMGWQAQLRLEQGRYAEAQALADEVLALPRLSAIMKLPALTVQAWVALRCGHPGAGELADEALGVAQATQELHRILPLLLARAEAAWLAGDSEAGRLLLQPLLGRPELAANPWTGGAFAVWLARCGGPAEQGACRAAPWALELAGQHEAAALAWTGLGLPFESALARLQQARAGREPAAALEAAVQGLMPLGAQPALERVQRLARELGLSLRRGPYAAAREHPRGLTAREQQVLALLAEGLGNADIATRLGLGRRTVEHHVSAVLAKLGAQGRSQAVAMAWRDRLI